MIAGLPKLAERAVVALERIADTLEVLTDRSARVAVGVERLANAEDNYCGAPLGGEPPMYCVKAQGHEGHHMYPNQTSLP